MQKNLHTQIIDALVEQGYIVIRDALDAKLAKDLHTLAKDGVAYRPAGISSKSDLHRDANRRGDKIAWLEEDGGVQSSFLNFSESLRQSINKELYLGLTYYEAHLAFYDVGDFYEKHLDSFKGFKNRVVTTVYYLNDGWDEDDGGELVIYDAKGVELGRVMPEANTLVVFMSERFPHEVLPAKKERYSIAGWFRIDKR